ncbi:MAG: tetratricopeptide repeat protein [Sphingobacteriales bacterium]|mgnify:CR=1 FL=1|jgi:tetratricopeptide (TPR) repeat protein|nr:tetratricopeptide repeat protein [Sphingobacteriales bacterium]MBP9140681.1 tetratricopeptide repeat protein [Chitinophagales bacterium]MDA0198896.1 tetratricopeptide repeat protein [Bacteroidota bacterium]MBK7528385.1 tetratricopeptide repeat protein [Sphingobacteriales bacterium]MBK8680152.1 tetratricopeptide repeat protein [Sphingobacteriales bacterium]
MSSTQIANLEAQIAQAPTEAEKINLWQQVAQIQSEIFNYEASIEALITAIELAKTHNPPQVPALKSELAVALGRVGQPQQGYDLAISVLEEIKDGDDYHLKAATLRRIGILCYEAEQAPQAVDFLKQAINVIETHLYTDLQAPAPLLYGSAQASLGEVLLTMRQDSDALTHLKKAIPVFEEHNEPMRLGLVYKNLTELMNRNGKLDQALQCAQHAGEAFIGADMPELAAQQFRTIGRLYEQKSQNEKAITAFEQAYEIAQINDLSFEMADSLYQIGYVYALMRRWPTALDYYEKALPLAQTANDDLLVDTITDSIAVAQKKVLGHTTRPSDDLHLPKTDDNTDGLFGKFKSWFKK